jgi:glutamate dehydrogenase/leucine dehydrogenase
MAKSGSRTNKKETFASIEKILTEVFDEVLSFSSDHQLSLRKSALALATIRLVRTMEARGWI